jgi:Protein of unknown function (DUF1579)
MQRSLTWGAGTLLVVFCATLSPGQDANAPVAQRAAMAKLDFLKGEWKGESWTEFATGTRQKSQGTETVQSKLGGLLLTIEGVHRRVVDGEVVHHAFAVISYDEREKRYRLQAFTERGGYTDAKAMVTDGKFEWGFRLSATAEIRYTITLNDQGQWFEIGEISRDGQGWSKVIEMTLTRVKEG